MVSYVNKPPYNSVITVFYFIYHVLISSSILTVCYIINWRTFKFVIQSWVDI